jgi:Ca2+-binding RTX toxin-like protein
MHLIRTQRALIAATLVASVQLLSVATPTAGASVNCVYTASNHRIKVTISGGGFVTLSRDSLSRIKVNGIWCDNAATVYNTDQINVFAGDGDQIVIVNTKQNGGFQPGFTNEAGSSDEVEFSISLGNGNADGVDLQSDSSSVHFVAGRSSGSFALLGRVNLNANEATGVDADMTLIVGIEQLVLVGSGGGDTFSGAGGYGTGESYTGRMRMFGNDGSDTLVGGAAADWIYAGAGADTLKGGSGADYLDSKDGTGGEQVFGGPGNDTCNVDAADLATSC